MSSRPFKIPWAVASTGWLENAETATRDGVYRCLECAETLVLRHGEVRRAHFAHRTESRCTRESLFHLLAKTLIVQKVRQSRMGGPAVSIRRTCDVYMCNVTSTTVLPERVVTALPEHRISSGRVVDVALIDSEKVLCAVEVLYTHAVDQKKAADLTMPWLEVRAEDVLENPFVLVAVQHGLRPWTCKECKEALATLDFAGARSSRSKQENDEVLGDFLRKTLEMP